MSLNSRKKLVEVAKVVCRDLRKRATDSEEKLWEQLRNRQLLNKKFYRQYPIFYDLTGRESFFVADFYCYEEKLIIELDGEYHKYRLTEDIERTLILDRLGLKVIRFKNNEVEGNINAVLGKITEELLTHPSPSLSKRRAY
ncbi:MAG: endonuclease domain-containing protein [Ignavibacteriales bacterium]|nr:endonuclease domain-containing protein [Ignavibacteriales bacterium]